MWDNEDILSPVKSEPDSVDAACWVILGMLIGVVVGAAWAVFA